MNVDMTSNNTEVKLRDKKSDTENVRPVGVIEIDESATAATAGDFRYGIPEKRQSPVSQDGVRSQTPDLSQYLHNRNPTLEELKSDSLNSASQACCSPKQAFNIYNKALESAKKALPKNKPKNRYSGAFPRSFGEDFHSLGPEGFYYLDDSQTECSIDYRDIEFNRDSYMLPGGDTMPELSEEEFYQTKMRADVAAPSMQLPSPPPPIPENTPLGSVENLPTDAKRKPPSFLERLFKKDKSKSKQNKARSEPREVQAKSNFRAQSLPPPAGAAQATVNCPPVKITEDGQLWFQHRTVPAPNNPETMVVSNVSRQQPVKLVYARPPEIIVQEVTNLADAVDTLPHLDVPASEPVAVPTPVATEPKSPAVELAEKTMLEILDDAIKQLQEENQIPAKAVDADKSEPKTAKRKRSLRIGKPKFLQKLDLSRTGDAKAGSFFDGRRFLKPKLRKPAKVLRRQLSTETEPLGSFRKKTKLPAESYGSAEHLYERLPVDAMAIEIPVGVPLDAPYTEEREEEEPPSISQPYRYVPDDEPKTKLAKLPDDDLNLKMPQLSHPAINLAEDLHKPVQFPTVRHPESPLPPPPPEPEPVPEPISVPVRELTPELVPEMKQELAQQLASEPVLEPEFEQPTDADSGSARKKQLRNMVGSFKSKMKGVKERVQQQVHKRPQQRAADPKVVDYKLKPKWENVDWPTANHLDGLESDNGRVDPTIDDEEYYDPEADKPRKKAMRKFKMAFSPPDPEGPSFGEKNRVRLQQIRSRAQESLQQITEKIRQQKNALQAKTKPAKPARPPAPRFEPYQPYDLHFASDSELSPGTGVDSLRRSKVYQELAEGQQRLEMYMSPVDRHEPRRPPRRKSNGSMRSLTGTPGRRVVPKHPPPRPPPPRFTTSVPSVMLCESEISLSDVYGASCGGGDGKRGRFPRRQRVPAEIFYQNVRLNYRPKKSYVELLQKSQPFQSTVSVQKATIERSQSTGQLYGRYRPPVPMRTKMPNGSRATSVVSSRHPCSSDAEEPTQIDMAVFERFERREAPRLLGQDCACGNPRCWEPFTWKVKRCRSFTELEVRQRLKKQCPETNLDEIPDTRPPEPEMRRKAPPARPPLPPQRKRAPNLFEMPYAACDDTYYNIDINPNLMFSSVSGQARETDTAPGTTNGRRPLPAPPVPPRPRLIPAHYGSHPRPLTRDVACDTSENGFASYIAPAATKLPSESVELLPDEDEVTLVERTAGEASPSSAASPSVYMDARSQVSVPAAASAEHAAAAVAPESHWSSDDDTINDDLSSLSSANFQSVASAPNDSFLHRLAGQTDNDYEQFNQQFRSQTVAAVDAGGQQPSSEENSPSCTLKHKRQSYISTSSSNSSVSVSSTFSYSSESHKSLVIQVNQSSEAAEVATSDPSTQVGRSHSDGSKEEVKKKKAPRDQRKSSADAIDTTSCTAVVISGVQPPTANQPALRENLSSLPQATPNGSKPDKRYYCAHEFFTTERDYVDVLLMLTKEFKDYIRPYVTPKWLDTFFRPLSVVTPINEQLLEELRTRVMVDWDDNPHISDIIIQICPYFKEYSIYIREYERLKFLLDDARTRFEEFESRLQTFESSDRCRKLPVKAYLLKPIQRLPQYRLMLLQYLKCLGPEDPERPDTEKALQVVTEVVNHMERESLMVEQSMTLNELRSQIILTRPTRIVQPGRVLIRRGQLDKVSRKDVHVRHFILFNDVLFYLAPVVNGMYKLKEELPLLGMQVELANNFPNEFVVRSVKRSFALLTKGPEEREDWVKDLRKAIADYTEKQESFKKRNQDSPAPAVDASSLQLSPAGGEADRGISLRSPSRQEMESRLGDLAPVWLHDSRVSMCHSCAAQFTFINRRHHCRACGQIFCAPCSSHQIRLKYLNYNKDRVCDDCYQILSARQSAAAMGHPAAPPSPSPPEAEPDYANLEDALPRITVSGSLTPRVMSYAAPLSSLSVSRKSRSNSCHELQRNDSQSELARNNNIRLSSRLRQKNLSSVLVEVSANDPSATICGYLFQFRRQKKCWKRYWFVIKDMVLYTFKASDDVHASESLPLPGYQVAMAQESIKGHPAELTIKLSHPGQSTIYFYAEAKEDCQRWFECFKEASLSQTIPAGQ